MDNRDRPLRVAIDAPLSGDGASGGVEQVVIGLASGLCDVGCHGEEYVFLVPGYAHRWLEPYLAPPCRLHPTAAPRHRRYARTVVRRGLRRAAEIAAALGVTPGRRHLGPPRSDGTVERAGVDVVHFATQAGFLTDVPSVYQPHDLQHLHFPEHFDAVTRLRREATYRPLCEQARVVVAMTEWGKRDLVEHYGLDPGKVHVVPWAPVLDAYPSPTPADLAEVAKKHALPEAFLLYPAQTWQHKNHLRLLEALAAVRRSEGVTIRLVCTGRQTGFFSRIQERANELGIAPHVRFLGFVSAAELRALYELARGLVFPSLFEGWGMPVTEAFRAGVPVACSEIGPLTEHVGDAALLFDPRDTDEIASAVSRLWSDEALRERLVESGTQRVAPLSWTRTARIFRAHYHRIADHRVTDEDRELLDLADASVRAD